MAITLKASKPGRHFRIYAFKPDRGQGYIMASEVIIERNEEGRIISYTSNLFDPDYANVRVMVEGRMTAKNKAAALAKVIEHLTANAMVEPNQEVIGDLD